MVVEATFANSRDVLFVFFDECEFFVNIKMLHLPRKAGRVRCNVECVDGVDAKGAANKGCVFFGKGEDFAVGGNINA